MTEQEGVWTDYVPLESIEDAVRNPKRHLVDALAVLIAEHGYMHVGIRDERTGRSVAGHGRKKALISLHVSGAERPWGIRLADDGRGWLVPVQRGWASRDDRQAEEVISALNRAQDFAGVDSAIEWSIFDDLNAYDPDALDRLRVSDEDMERLFAEVNPDLSDITGDPDGQADPGPALGDDQDTPLDALEDTGRDIACPACGHIFPSKP